MSDKQLDERVKEMLSALTLQEKISLLPAGQAAIPRLGIAEYHAGQEGAHGVVDRDGGKATVFPQPLGLSMTWDEDLLHEAGSVIGDEARGFYDATNHRSFLSLFFPTIDMERDPRWGRNEEAYGEDPFLAGKLSASLIRGVQGNDPLYVKAVATPKHFYANNFERDRGFCDSVLPHRLKQDYYLRVFKYAFTEGKALSVMTAYNKIDGVVGMLNPELKTLLREQWGCEGYFVTDGGAFKLSLTEHHAYKTYAESFAAAIKAGMNVFLDEAHLVIPAANEALERGLVTEAEIDDALFYTLRVRFRLGHFGEVAGKPDPYIGIKKDSICSVHNTAIARKCAEEAVVLLKNDGFLPLHRPKKIVCVGLLASENMPDWYSGNPPYETTPLAGLKEAFPNADVVYEDGCDIVTIGDTKVGAYVRVTAEGGVLFDADEKTRSTFRVADWGYGAFCFMETKTKKYLSITENGDLLCTSDLVWGWFPRELFFVKKEKSDVYSFLPEQKRQEGGGSDFGVATRRGDSIYNKPYADINPPPVDKINALLAALQIRRVTEGVKKAAETAKGADAVFVFAGNHALIGARECLDRETLSLPEHHAALLEEASRANANTALVIVAGYPYSLLPEEKLARAVLFTTHGQQEVGHAIAGAIAGKFSPAGRLSQTWYFDESVLPDYNDYDIIKNKCTYLYHEKPVLHPFGYGLSYTSFEYGTFSAKNTADKIEFSFTLRNSGKIDSDEVPQLYFASDRKDVKRPLKQLCAFTRLYLKAGEAKTVVLTVPRDELLFWDETGKNRALDNCGYRFMLGADSADIRQEIRIENVG